jgi:hypothetical protein
MTIDTKIATPRSTISAMAGGGAAILPTGSEAPSFFTFPRAGKSLLILCQPTIGTTGFV